MFNTSHLSRIKKRTLQAGLLSFWHFDSCKGRVSQNNTQTCDCRIALICFCSLSLSQISLTLCCCRSYSASCQKADQIRLALVLTQTASRTASDPSIFSHQSTSSYKISHTYRSISHSTSSTSSHTHLHHFRPLITTQPIRAKPFSIISSTGHARIKAQQTRITYIL